MINSQDTILASFIRDCSIERGLDAEIIKALLRKLIKCLHEFQLKSGYRREDGNVLNQVYWTLGPEAAYHYCELLANDGRGHDAETVRTVLEHQDSRAKRFGMIVERWQFEIDCEIENK